MINILFRRFRDGSLALIDYQHNARCLAQILKRIINPIALHLQGM